MTKQPGRPDTPKPRCGAWWYSTALTSALDEHGHSHPVWVNPLHECVTPPPHSQPHQCRCGDQRSNTDRISA